MDRPVGDVFDVTVKVMRHFYILVFRTKINFCMCLCVSVFVLINEFNSHFESFFWNE